METKVLTIDGVNVICKDTDKILKMFKKIDAIREKKKTYMQEEKKKKKTK